MVLRGDLVTALTGAGMGVAEPLGVLRRGIAGGLQGNGRMCTRCAGASGYRGLRPLLGEMIISP